MMNGDGADEVWRGAGRDACNVTLFYNDTCNSLILAFSLNPAEHSYYTTDISTEIRVPRWKDSTQIYLVSSILLAEVQSTCKIRHNKSQQRRSSHYCSTGKSRVRRVLVTNGQGSTHLLHGEIPEQLRHYLWLRVMLVDNQSLLGSCSSKHR